MLQEKGRIIAIPPMSSLKVLIESKIVYDSQFPLRIVKGAEIEVEIETNKKEVKNNGRTGKLDGPGRRC